MTLCVPCPAAVTVTATVPVTHLCPWRDETDEGHMTITWECQGSTVEIHALTGWLAGFAADRISHEDLTVTVAEHLSELPGIDGVRVRSTWHTAGAQVVVDRALPGQRVIGAGA